MSNLRAIIAQEILRSGSIPFARFMELALYCPNFGYYERIDGSPGRKGDFFTSVSVGPLFGELLAAQFAEWGRGIVDCGLRIADWQILEAGAHDGRLAVDILRWLKVNRPEHSRSLEYWILEPSSLRQKSQRETLGDLAGSVRWFTSWSDLPPTGVHGVIFANELLDAVPVHRLGWDAASQKWFEWGVVCAGDEFSWTKMPVAMNDNLWNSALRTPHFALMEVLPDGFTTEVCPAAAEWWREAARALKIGKLLTFDYGLSAEQFFTPERREGTLRAYYQHRQNNDLLARLGEQDLTAQVNFTAIREAGEREGLKTETFTSQGQFLVRVVETIGRDNPGATEWPSSRVRQFQTLTHPEHLGHSFQVLVQMRLGGGYILS